MQPSTNAELARAFTDASRREVTALLAELRAGGDAALDAPAYCQGWKARDAVAHLTNACNFFREGVQAAVAGRPPPPFDPAQGAARQDRLAAEPGAQLLGGLETAAAAWLDYLDSLDDRARETPVQMPFGVMPAWQLGGVMLDEFVVHRWDVRAPHTPDARLTAEAMPLLAPFMTPALSLLSVGEKRDGVWQIDVDEPRMGGPLSLRVQDGQVAVAPGPVPEAGARLTLDGDAYIRLVWGRLDLPAALASGQVRVEGDREQALALQRLFPGT